MLERLELHSLLLLAVQYQCKHKYWSEPDLRWRIYVRSFTFLISCRFLCAHNLCLAELNMRTPSSVYEVDIQKTSRLSGFILRRLQVYRLSFTPYIVWGVWKWSVTFWFTQIRTKLVGRWWDFVFRPCTSRYSKLWFYFRLKCMFFFLFSNLT